MCSGAMHRPSFSTPVRRLVARLRRFAVRLRRLCPELRRFVAYMSLQGLPGENNAGLPG